MVCAIALMFTSVGYAQSVMKRSGVSADVGTSKIGGAMTTLAPNVTNAQSVIYTCPNSVSLTADQEVVNGFKAPDGGKFTINFATAQVNVNGSTTELMCGYLLNNGYLPWKAYPPKERSNCTVSGKVFTCRSSNG